MDSKNFGFETLQIHAGQNLMLQLRQQGYHYTYQMHLHLMMQIKQLEFLH